MSRRMLVALLMCVLIAPAMIKAQPAPDGGGNQGQDANRRNRGNNQGGGGGGGGNFDPAQFRQRRMDQIKERLAAKDDEWKVIEPKLGKVMDAQVAAFQGRGGFGNRGGGGGGGNRGGGNADSPAGKARLELQETLDKPDASADDIAKKLTALRDVRDKARADLATAQKDLKEVLTQRQEAILVMEGQLE